MSKYTVKLFIISLIALYLNGIGYTLDNAEYEGSGNNQKERVFLRAILPTPVYSIKEIPTLFYDYETSEPRVKVDDKGHIRELEYIALKGTKFEQLDVFKFGRIYVIEVKTSDYPSAKHLFIDSNFVVRCLDDYPGRVKKLPDKKEVLRNLKSMVGAPYRWGGNYVRGIKQLLNYYPIGDFDKSKVDISAWILEGVDCSGMLYQATNGVTPRNTSDLVSYGTGIDIENLPVDKIMEKLQPLDLIVWNGHIVVVYDNESAIESRPRYPNGGNGGVRIHSLRKRLEEILSNRKPVNKYDKSSEQRQFVVRRFM